MLLEELAEDLVSATSGLLDGRIINIMNPDGIIIASTQPERIGTFHKGARDAAVSGKPVSIRPDQIQEYSGAREGYNMPLRVGGNIIGVVGILILMELCRRCVGLPILCVAGVLIVYAFINQLSYAGAVNGATLYDALKTIIYKLFYTTSGVIGTPINVCYTYILSLIHISEPTRPY